MDIRDPDRHKTVSAPPAAFHLNRLADSRIEIANTINVSNTPLRFDDAVNPDEPEYPDPNAPWYEKINPCHINHVHELDSIQHFFELFAPACQCCAGVRVYLLLAAFFLLAAGTGFNSIFVKGLAGATLFTVLAAMFIDILKRKRDAESRLRE